MDTNLKLSESLSKYLPQELATKFISEFNTEYTSNLPNESLTELIKKYGDCLSHKLQVDAKSFGLEGDNLEKFNIFIKDLNEQIKELKKYPPANIIWCGPVQEDGVSTMGAYSLNDQFPEQEIIFWALDAYVDSFKEQFKDRKNIRVLSIESYSTLIGITLEEKENAPYTLIDAIEDIKKDVKKYIEAGLDRSFIAREHTTITDYIKNTISIFNGGYVLDANLILTPTGEDSKRLIMPDEREKYAVLAEQLSAPHPRDKFKKDVWFLYYPKNQCITPGDTSSLNNTEYLNSVWRYHEMVSDFNVKVIKEVIVEASLKDRSYRPNLYTIKELSGMYGDAIVDSATKDVETLINFQKYSDITIIKTQRLANINFDMFKKYNNSHVLFIKGTGINANEVKTLNDTAFKAYCKYRNSYFHGEGLAIYNSLFNKSDEGILTFNENKYRSWREFYPEESKLVLKELDKAIPVENEELYPNNEIIESLNNSKNTEEEINIIKSSIDKINEERLKKEELKRTAEERLIVEKEKEEERLRKEKEKKAEEKKSSLIAYSYGLNKTSGEDSMTWDKIRRNFTDKKNSFICKDVGTWSNSSKREYTTPEAELVIFKKFFTIDKENIKFDMVDYENWREKYSTCLDLCISALKEHTTDDILPSIINVEFMASLKEAESIDKEIEIINDAVNKIDNIEDIKNKFKK